MKVIKRIFVITFATFLGILFIACDNIETNTVDTTCNHEVIVDQAINATCIESGLSAGSHCNLCGEILVAQEIIPPKGHSTSTGVCTGCGENFGVWELNYYVDQFDMPTNDAYISNDKYFIGTFSNSATNDSLLKVLFIVDKDGISFILYEYGSNIVKNPSYGDPKWYNITMRTATETKELRTGWLGRGNDRIFFDQGNYSTIINALKAGGEIKFLVVEEDNTTTSYLFTIDSSNFAELYENIK